MDSILSGPWKERDLLISKGFSYCSAMIVYNQNNFVMSHIPPIRADLATGKVDAGQFKIVRDYIDRMTSHYNEAGGIPRAQGYLLVSDVMPAELKGEMESWFASRRIDISGPKTNVYHHDDGRNDNKNIIRVPYDPTGPDRVFWTAK